MSKKAIGILVLLFWGLSSAPPAARGALPVIDSANLYQNFLQAARLLDQIQRQIEQLETMRRNLERISNPSWRDLRPYLGYLNELAKRGEGIAYSADGVYERFHEVMVGYLALPPEESYETVYRLWTRAALDTLAATLATAGSQAGAYQGTQDQLARLQALADGARGNLQALEVSNMLQGHVAQEVVKLNQLLAASMNAQNVYYGLLVTLEANREATERRLIQEAELPFHLPDGETGFTGMPPDWPWPCFGCTN